MEVARWLLGEEDHFSREDDFGLVGQLTFPANRFIDSVNLLIKAEDWLKKTHDYRIRRFLGNAPNAIWVVEGDPTVYYSKQAALTSQSFEGVISMPLIWLFVDRNLIRSGDFKVG